MTNEIECCLNTAAYRQTLFRGHLTNITGSSGVEKKPFERAREHRFFLVVLSVFFMNIYVGNFQLNVR